VPDDFDPVVGVVVAVFVGVGEFGFVEVEGGGEENRIGGMSVPLVGIVAEKEVEDLVVFHVAIELAASGEEGFGVFKVARQIVDWVAAG